MSELDEAIVVPPGERARVFEYVAERWPDRETAASLVAAVHASDIRNAEQPVTVTVKLDGESGSFSTQLGDVEISWSPAGAAESG